MNLFRQQAAVEGEFADFILDVVGFPVEDFGDEVEHLFGEFAVESVSEVFIGEHFVERGGLWEGVVPAERAEQVFGCGEVYEELMDGLPGARALAQEGLQLLLDAVDVLPLLHLAGELALVGRL